jgi:hypothetical protein
MPVLQVGAGYVWVTDKNATTTQQQKYAIAQLESSKITFKPKQEFINGNKQIEIYGANVGAEITGELKFRGLETGLLAAVFLNQYLSGAAALSKIVTLDAPSTVTTSAVTIANATSILQVRTPVAVGSLPAGGLMTRIASGTPTTGTYTVSGEGTASATITFLAGDATAMGSNQPLVSYVKAAASETKKLILQNAIPQQTIYFGIEGVGLFDGKQVNFNFQRVLITDLPDLFDGSEKFAERSAKIKIIADPYSDLVGEISFTESLT